MRRPDVVHPQVMEVLAPFYDESCTVQENQPTRTESGGWTDNWVTVGEMQQLDCRLFGKMEVVAGPAGDMVNATHRIALRGYYDEPVPGMRAVVGDINYEILGVEHDSEEGATSLVVARLLGG